MSPKKAKKLPIVENTNIENLEGDRFQQLQALYQKWYGCHQCALGENRDFETGGNPDIVFGDGDPSAPIMIVGEAPGDEEQSTGIPFFGPSGMLLNELMAQASLDPDVMKRYKAYASSNKSQPKFEEFQTYMMQWRKDRFFTTNIVSCRPPENRTPTNLEIKACWSRLHNIIYIVDPILIIAVGGSALKALLGMQNITITKARGVLHEANIQGRFRKIVYPVMPIFHPSFLLRTADHQVESGNYQKTVQDLSSAFGMVRFLMYHWYGHENYPL